MSHIETDRLILRRWRVEDRPAFAALNADPVVMRHFPAPLPRTASDELIDHFERSFEESGYGVWALVHRAGGSFLGCAGLLSLSEDIVPGRHLEAVWRLQAGAWGSGYATEAARAALRFAFLEVGAPGVYALTSVHNDASTSVMRRLGMRFVREFDHPRLPVDSPLLRHVLYRAAASQWPPAGTGGGLTRLAAPG